MQHTKRTKRMREGQEGFTLIELMVSLSLFVVVVLAAVASLYTVNSASKKVQAMRTSLDNLNFAIESMSRAIRTGTDIGCNNSAHANCPLSGNSPGQGIVLNNTLGYKGKVQYYLDNTIYSSGVGTIVKQIGQVKIALTSPEIDIKNLLFYVDGACNASGVMPPDTCQPDTVQPNVIIFMQGSATAGGAVAPFAVQTLVTQRTFD